MHQRSDRQVAFLGLGSNVGNRHQHLEIAIEAVQQKIGHVVGRSSVYETEPWGVANQPYYLNMVLRVLTDLGPVALLHSIQEIENTLGRQRSEKWGPRTIDIDILYYGNSVLDLDQLQIPHPEITERRFVLVPLVELDPNFLHPIFKLSQKELLDFCEDKSSIIPYNLPPNKSIN